MNHLINLHQAFLSQLKEKNFSSFTWKGVISLMPRNTGLNLWSASDPREPWIQLTELDKLLIGKRDSLFARIGTTIISKEEAIALDLEDLVLIFEEKQVALIQKMEEELANRKAQPIDTTGFRSWRSLLIEALEWREDEWCDIEHVTLSEAELDELFDADSYVTNKGRPITAWTKNWVYFAHSYDGKESIRSVPRNPVNQGSYIDASEPEY